MYSYTWCMVHGGTAHPWYKQTHSGRRGYRHWCRDLQGSKSAKKMNILECVHKVVQSRLLLYTITAVQVNHLRNMSAVVHYLH